MSEFRNEAYHGKRNSVMNIETVQRVFSRLDEMEQDSNQEQSAFMTRQAEKAQSTALSPMDEMKLAKSEMVAMALREDYQLNPDGKNLKVSTSIAELSDRKSTEEMTAAELIDFMEKARLEEQAKLERTFAKELAKIPAYIVHPYNKLRINWDLLSIVFITYNAILVPFQVAFETDEQPLTNEFLKIIERIIDVFFVLDLVLNFFSAFDDKGTIVHDQRRIAIRYLKSWFLVDFISAFPYNYVFSLSQYDKIPQLVKFLKLFRLARLFRMFRITRILNRLEYSLFIRSTMRSIVKFVFLVSFSSHWFSCFFYLISVSEKESGWVIKNGLHEQRIFDQYIASMYWSIMTMTTVGYGDVSAILTTERMFAIMTMILGSGIFAYGITNVVAVVSNLNEEETNFRMKMDRVNSYMEVRELPAALRGEIREFLYSARNSREKKLANESLILSELSALLRSKIALDINDHMLSKMPLFHDSDPNFLLEIGLSMRMFCFAPFEDVIVEGEIGHEMFFIFRGAVEVLKNGRKVSILGENQYFGEQAVLNNDSRRTASIRTLCFSELRVLSRDRFVKIMERYPNQKDKISEYSKKRNQISMVPPLNSASSSKSIRTDSKFLNDRSVLATGPLHRNLSFSSDGEEDSEVEASPPLSSPSTEDVLATLQESLASILESQKDLEKKISSIELKVEELDDA